MIVTLEAHPKTLGLTTRDVVKAETGIAASFDALLDRLIEEATGWLEGALGRSLPRSKWRAQIAGSNADTIRLPRFPVVRIDALSIAGETITPGDVEIVSPDSGLIRLPGRRFVRDGSRLTVDATFVAGFLLPGDDVTGSATLSAAASSDAFSDSTGALPALLVAGDWIRVSGFAQAANNGRHRVSGTPTASSVATTSALVDEAAGGTRSIFVRNLPPELERAAIEWIKARFFSRSRDGAVESEEVDGVKVSYRTPGSGSGLAGADEALLASLRRWIVHPPGLRSIEVARG